MRPWKIIIKIKKINDFTRLNIKYEKKLIREKNLKIADYEKINSEKDKWEINNI